MRRHVGIDVSKAELVIHVLPDEQAWTQPNTPQGQRALAQRLAGMDCERIVLEASGGYERAVLQVLRQADLPVVRMPADRPRKLAQALGLHAKTDALDARLLAIAAQHIPTTPTPVVPGHQQSLRELLDLRATLVGQRDAHRRRLEHITSAKAQHRCREVIALLNQQIQTLTQEIEQQGKTCSSLPKVPGLGTILRAVLAARLPELGTLPPRKLAALVGLAPFNHDSGCWKGQRRIKGGRADVRRVLYMSTWASIRAKSPLANTYARLRAAGKPAKVAIVACMHKFLRWLNAIARDQAPYAPPAIAAA
ncbi:IS110 family transposase [Xanthomonas sp. D-109]|uniref:IS110 family transposase n=1 Tax=Xanthomonas sp. D-109 TaxID=2821274 RepID=UPI001ADCFA4C|nr:IS110 family transposase [Xanthomonas sp. D-109]MBO9883899.1 IS110 family transposase [Xanthomonas sp. D-109]